MPMSFSLNGLKISLSQPLTLSRLSLFLFPSCGQFGAEGLENPVTQKSCLLKLCVPMTPGFVLLCDGQSVCEYERSVCPLSYPQLCVCQGLCIALQSSR